MLIRALLLLLLVTGVTAVVGQPRATADDARCLVCSLDTTIAPSQNGQSFVGRQVIIADGRGGAQWLSSNESSCAECVWKIQPRCELRRGFILDLACKEGPRAGACVLSGGKSGTVNAVFVARSGGPYRLTGTVCLGEGATPVSLADVQAAIRAYVDRLVPPAPTLQMRPVGGTTLVNLPTLFLADGSASAAGRLFPAGITVDVRAVAASWTWRIDGGAASFTTSFPGRRYDAGHDPRTDPDYYASYTFRTLGAHRVTCTVAWTATATMPGLGELPVQGSVQRFSAPLPVQVKEARAQLVATP